MTPPTLRLPTTVRGWITTVLYVLFVGIIARIGWVIGELNIQTYATSRGWDRLWALDYSRISWATVDPFQHGLGWWVSGLAAVTGVLIGLRVDRLLRRREAATSLNEAKPAEPVLPAPARLAVDIAQPRPQPDSKLADAVAWASFREWGKHPATATDMEARVEEMQQAIEEGKIKLWGKDSIRTYGTEERVPREHFNHYRLTDDSVLDQEGRTVHRLFPERGGWFRALRVNKAQVEKRWPAGQVKRPPSGLDLPYRKAVLQIGEVKSSRSKTGETFTNADCVIEIKNVTAVALLECSLHLVRMDTANGTIEIDEAVRKDMFAVPANQSKRLMFIHRDLKDVVSRPPHLLRLATQDLPLVDGQSYALEIELRSEYEYPTLVRMELQVSPDPQGAVLAKLVDQRPDDRH